MTDSPEVDGSGENKADVARVEIVLVGDQLDPLEVSRRLGIQASRGFLKGDVVRTSVPRPHGLWAIGAEAQTVAAAGTAALEQLAAARGDLRRVADELNATVSVSVWWEPGGGQGGFTLPGELARRLFGWCDVVNVYCP